MGFFRKLIGLEEDKPIPKLGRNDQCWCESGKKYKNCHLDSDRRKKTNIRPAKA